MADPGSRPVRCRFAPSPTGYLHVGGARTALFNYLFARRLGGKFILRIEDTDLQRSTDEATKAIFEGLDWLRISHDEGPFFQSKRFDLYQTYAKKLLAAGYAYRCACTPEELEAVRESQRASQQKPQYNRKHRPQTASPQDTTLPTGEDAEPFVIRLRTPIEGETSFNDTIVGPIVTANAELDDFIIIRSDGSPTYNFVVVVDDIDMQITHVIRGMDHISNTPKQILIYRALGAETPQFAHVPMILGQDKKKLSKRHGATSVIEYRQEGYLADAFVNYLARLGWSHGDQEIFTRPELEKLFSLEQVGKSAAVFDFEKLSWVNAEHLKVASVEAIVSELVFLLPAGRQDPKALLGDASFIKLINSLRARAKTLREIAEQCAWYFADENAFQIDEAAAAKHLTEKSRANLSAVLDGIRELKEFNEAGIEDLFRRTTETLGIKLVEIAQPARVALTGKPVSPPINIVIEVLGRSRTLARLERGIALCSKSSS